MNWRHSRVVKWASIINSCLCFAGSNPAVATTINQKKGVHMSVMDRTVVLKLNRSWMPVGFAPIGKSVIDLCAGVCCYALDIDYALNEDGTPNFDQPTKMLPVDWETWITLPTRSWDIPLHSPHMVVRAPTVLIAKNFDKMPTIRYGRKPSGRQIWERDKGVDQYTGKLLTYDDASVDHVIPVSRGGQNEWNNMVLTHKKVNFQKGNKFNDEVGLKLIREPKRPSPQPMYALITEPKHVDWKPFLIKK